MGATAQASDEARRAIGQAGRILLGSLDLGLALGLCCGVMMTQKQIPGAVNFRAALVAALVAFGWLGVADAGAAEMKVTADFEGGSMAKFEQVGEALLRVGVKGQCDQDGRNRQPSWFYFRIDGAPAGELVVELNGLSGEYNYKPHTGSGMRNTIPVYSYDDQTWRHFEASEWDGTNSTLRVRLKGANKTVWIARQAPYTTAHLERLLKTLRGNPCYQESVVGKSIEGRPIVLLTVTNPDIPEAKKKVVWLMARQHAWESGTSWVAEGALRFLLSGDPEAARIREKFIFKVFPLADPDGVVHGGVRFNLNGYDLNRNWDAVNPKLMPEIYCEQQAIFQWVDGGHRIDFYLTMHNTESADYVEGPAEYKSLGDHFWKVLSDTTSFYSPKGARADAVGTTTAGMKGRMTVYQGLYHDRKVPAYLIEQMVDSSPKISRAPTVQDRLEFGPGLVRAMCDAAEFGR